METAAAGVTTPHKGSGKSLTHPTRVLPVTVPQSVLKKEKRSNIANGQGASIATFW